MAHSQAEKPAGVRPVGRTSTDRNNQGGRGDETTRLAGVDGVDQALLGQGQRQQAAATNKRRIRLRGCHFADWLRCSAGLSYRHRRWADGTKGVVV